MNNTCPSCGALYNVAAKDIGRRLKCKKCNSALTVTDGGLVMDDEDMMPGSPARPSPDDGEPTGRRSRRSGSGFNPLNALNAVGGVPGVLFGVGVFFVLFFTFLQVLASASNMRAAEAANKLSLEEEIAIRKKLPKGKKDRGELNIEEQKKFDEEKKTVEDLYYPQKKEAEDDKRSTEIGNKRLRLIEGYGAMFGFMLLSVGCLGFLLTERPMLLRIVAGIILIGMVLGLFRIALGGVGAGIGAGLSIG